MKSWRCALELLANYSGRARLHRIQDRGSHVHLPHPSPLARTQGDCDNARSRWKTGLPAQDGDDDLILWYYCVLHPMTASGKEKRKEMRNTDEWKECKERLSAKYGDWVMNYGVSPSACYDSSLLTLLTLTGCLHRGCPLLTTVSPRSLLTLLITYQAPYGM